MSFSREEVDACGRLITLALEEDLGTGIDLTSEAVIPATARGRAVFVARTSGVLAGIPAAALVSCKVDRELEWTALQEDGVLLEAGERLATLSGSLRSLLAAERTCLNFLQHLSGIATLTRRYVEAVAGLNVKILDTRKTIPGWRRLAKYAVRQGGGHNHRMGLYDGILIKDNHLKGLSGTFQQQIADAVHRARLQDNAAMTVEIEVESLDQLDVALACRPAIVMLDNMPIEMMREAIRRRNIGGAGIQLEASGGVNLQSVRAIAETGVDRISIGALTHSAPALDIALDYEN